MNTRLYFFCFAISFISALTHSAYAEPRREERREEAARRIEGYSPARQLVEIKAKLEAARTEEEREHWKKEEKRLEEYQKFLAGIATTVTSAVNSSTESSRPSSNLRGRTETNTAPTDTESGHSRFRAPENRPLESSRPVEPSLTIAQKVQSLKKIYENSSPTDSKASIDLLEKTYNEVKDNPEAREGLDKLLTEIIKSKGDPIELLKGIAELTKKNGVNAKDTLEIMRATCPDRCLNNKGACRIASQIWQTLATGTILAGLSAYTLSNMKVEDLENGKQKVILDLKEKENPAKTKTETIIIEDKEQAVEKFPPTPQRSN